MYKVESSQQLAREGEEAWEGEEGCGWDGLFKGVREIEREG